MKSKSGFTRIVKAALFLVLIITVQTGSGQFLGHGHSKKKSLKRTYKCEKVGVQKVKHIQGSAKTIRPIVTTVTEKEVLVASIRDTETELNPVDQQENDVVSTPTITIEKKKDTIQTRPLRLLPMPVYFRYDSYRLDIIDLTQIALAVEYVKEGNSITLVGHTDDWGSEKYNHILSDKRANIIRDMMIELGCKPELIIAKGEGEKYPVATNEHAEGRQSNRRVEFLIALNQ